MRNSAIIELIGYVYGEIEAPMPDKYPNWVKFSLSVSRKWKDRNGEEKKEVSWYKCTSWSEGLSKTINNHVQSGMGMIIKGFPKPNAYIDKEGKAKSQIEVNITDMNILTYPDQKRKIVSNESKEADSNSAKYESDDIPF